MAYSASMVVGLILIGHLVWSNHSLTVDEPLPGSTPFPSSAQKLSPPGGGWSPVDLSEPLNYELLTHLVEIAIDIKQDQESAINKRYVFHKLIRISSASKQISHGSNYDVVFYVGERSCVRYRILPLGGEALSRDNSSTVNPRSGPSGGGNASASLIVLPPRRYYHGCTVSYNGQFGKCFFRINHQSRPNTVDVAKAKCEKTSREDAYRGD